MNKEDYQKLFRIDVKQRRTLISFRMAGHMELMSVMRKSSLENIIKSMFSKNASNEEDHNFLGFKTLDEFQEAQHKFVVKMSDEDFLFLEMFWSRVDRINLIDSDDPSCSWNIDAILFDSKGKLSILPTTY